MSKTLTTIFIILLALSLLTGCGARNSSLNGDSQKQSGAKPQEYGVDSKGTISFQGGYFGHWHYEIEANPRKYEGKKVVITGFVHRGPDFQQNEFKIARLQPSGCFADAYVLGLICRSDKATDFKKDEWVTVKGTLVVTSYIDPSTKFEYQKVHLVPESIEKIPAQSDYTI